LKVLLTGATGFVGSRLVEALASLDSVETVYAVSRGVHEKTSSRLHWIKADLGQQGWTDHLPNDPVEVVIHLAQSDGYRDFPERVGDVFDVNVKATYELANWSRTHGVQNFLFASSGNVYGFADKEFQEDDDCRPDAMYGASKLAAEILLQPFAECFGITVLRLFGVYGPGQKDKLIPDLIDRIQKGKEIVLDGGIGVKLNPLYVTDLTEAIIRLVSKGSPPSFDIYNIGGSEIVDIRQLVAELELISGSSAHTRETDVPPKSLVGSTAKLNRILSWSAETPINKGLIKTYMDSVKTGVVD